MGVVRGAKKGRDVLFGSLAGLAANALVIALGAVTCGGDPGEIPPFFALLLSLWLIQWIYLTPAMIVMLLLKRRWMALGSLIAGIATGVASVAGLLVIGSTTV